jgi:hypothetical protein
MAYIYLLDIYKVIDQRLEDAQASLNSGCDDPVEKAYQRGRIKALTDFMDYLTANFHPRLPRRIRESYNVKNQPVAGPKH